MEEAAGSSLSAPRALGQVVRVWRGLPNEQGRFCGTAFFVTPIHALTARHVVAGSANGSLFLQVPYGGVFFARVEEVRPHPNPAIDVALLLVDNQMAADAMSLVGIDDPLPLLVGNQLDIVGFADEHSSAEVRRTAVSGIEGAAAAAILQTAPPRGLSGGPALSPDGRLRGLVFARDADKARGYVVPLSLFREFLEANGARAVLNPPRRQAEHPGAEEDRDRLKRARELLLRWRENHLAEIAKLSRAAARAREWRQQPPDELTSEVSDLIGCAAATGRALEDLPVSELEFARSYGLDVHPTVFWGQALYMVESANFVFRDPSDEVASGTARRLGHPGVPTSYSFEMMARVLESAVALADFGPGSLPTGYLEPQLLEMANLSDSGPLLLMRTNNDPFLSLVELDETPRLLGTIVARDNPISVDAAKVMPNGGLEVIGTDSQHRYRWSDSAQRPSAQFEHEPILFAGFPGQSMTPVIISDHGEVRELYADGRSTVLVPAQEQRCAAAALWRDALDSSRVRLLLLSKDSYLSSISIDAPGQSVVSDIRDALAVARFPDRWFLLSDSKCELGLTSLEGFPCALVTARLPLGTVMMFLEPVRLVPVRPLRRLEGQIWNPVIAADRWLVAPHYAVRTGEPLISLLDLKASTDSPVAVLENTDACTADIYSPMVTAESRNEFTLYFTLRFLDRASRHCLCRWRWPSRSFERLQTYSDLRLSPVLRD